MYCVYWIHSKEYSDIFFEGYVGISKDFKERMRFHKKNKRETILTNAIKKYSWNNLQKDIIISNLNLEQALLAEAFYRPRPRIGWNLLVGGILGVDSSWYLSEENKSKHSKATS